MAKLLIVLGLALAVLGVVLLYFPGLLSWFGRLPGDIRVEGRRGGFYFPIVSMLILSVLVSLVLHWLRK